LLAPKTTAWQLHIIAMQNQDLIRGDGLSGGRFDIMREILAYLVEHPEAEDTLEGILKWWLLERKIKYQKKKVKEALADLVKKGLVLECEGGDRSLRYRINQSRCDEIQVLLIKERLESIGHA
jgi:hypothetical protein